MTVVPAVKTAAAWLPAAIYMALIWLVSSLPMTLSLDDFPLGDKGIHVIEYAVLAALCAGALARTRPRMGLRTRLVAAVAVAVFWGLLDEIHQAYVPTRHADSADVVADMVGAMLGALCFIGIRAVRHRSAG